MANEIPETPMVGVVMGSKSDWDTMRRACEVLSELGVPYEAKVVSAHRTPERLFRYGSEAEGRGLEVLIAGAGVPRTCRGCWRRSRCCRCWACRSRVGSPRGPFAPVDRADAAGRTGRHAGHRQLGSHQRRHTGRGDPGKEVSGDPCGRCPLRQAQTEAVGESPV